jgi:hypothetical protein
MEVEYTGQMREESLIIYKNILDHKIPDKQMGQAVAKMLRLFPFDPDYYQVVLSTFPEDCFQAETKQLERYAKLFDVDFDGLRNEIEKARTVDSNLYILFGDSQEDVEGILEENYFFKQFKESPKGTVQDIVADALQGISGSELRSKIYASHDGNQAEDKFKKALASYAPMASDEKPLLCYDSTSFGSAKDGCVITDQRIYAHNMLESGWAMRFGDITQVRLSGSDIYINEKRISIIGVNGDNRYDFCDFLEFILMVLKYLNRDSLLDNDSGSAPRALPQPAPAKETVDSATLAKKAVSEITNTKIREYVFYWNENPTVNTKFNNALSSYAFIGKEEQPLILFDNTAFGGAKDGLVITDKKVYCHNMWENPFFLNLSDISNVDLNGSDLIFNNQKLSIQLIPSGCREEFKNFISNIINQLK